jgi:CBS domain-containing protein
MSKTVADVMTSEVLTVKKETPLKEAIQILADKKISALPVVAESGKLVGILSEGDLMWQESGVEAPPYIMLLDSIIYLQNPAQHDKEIHKALGQTVGEVMSDRPLTIKPEQLVREAARLMHDKKIRRLPVIDEQERVIGIITQGDIVRMMAME